jgi:2-polyprenyl-3-methyl-5-hydroxy-6-metoxy-1,4-benzoquinol methylase
MEDLGAEDGGQILDVGSVCGENIDFLARRVKKLCVCDMFFHLIQGARNGPRSARMWERLDYLEGSFDGILLWDLMDRLEDSDAEEIAKRCYNMAKSDGMVMMLAQGERTAQKKLNTFVISDDSRVYLRPKQDVELPLYMRRNRQIMDLLDPFTLMTSFIYRNGTREFLFRRF